MAAPAILKIDVIADATKAAKTLQGVGTTAQNTGSRLRGFATAVGGAFAVGAIANFGSSAISAAEEAAAATAGLETAFRNAGDTTGQAALDAQAYASELSALIGVEDETILSAQTALAAFSAVSDETARSSGIFDRATAAAADLSAKGFGEMESVAKTLGKILENPARGLAKLERLTGPLTEAQRDLITNMAEAGDTAGAQAAVLDLLEARHAGAAEATATSSEKMGVAFGEVQEQIGTALLPAFQGIADILLNNVIPVVSGFITFITDNIDWIGPLAAGITGIALAVKGWAVVQDILNNTLKNNPIGLVITAIGLLVTAIVIAYKKSETFRRIVDAALSAVSKAFSALWEAAKAAFDAIVGAAQAVFDWLKTNWPTLLAVLTGPFGLAVLAIVKNWDKIKAGITAVIDWIKDKFNALKDFFSGLVTSIGDLVTSIVDALKAPLNAVIGAWNNLSITLPRIDIPSWVPIIGGKGFGGNTIHFPDIPLLARGGILEQATLFIGGEAGREIVSPEKLLRQIMREEGGGGAAYVMNVYPRTVNPSDIAWGFRRMELVRTGR